MSQASLFELLNFALAGISFHLISLKAPWLIGNHFSLRSYQQARYLVRSLIFVLGNLAGDGRSRLLLEKENFPLLLKINRMFLTCWMLVLAGLICSIHIVILPLFWVGRYFVRSWRCNLQDEPVPMACRTALAECPIVLIGYCAFFTGRPNRPLRYMGKVFISLTDLLLHVLWYRVSLSYC